jgi:hypothetical protein
LWRAPANLPTSPFYSDAAHRNDCQKKTQHSYLVTTILYLINYYLSWPPEQGVVWLFTIGEMQVRVWQKQVCQNQMRAIIWQPDPQVKRINLGCSVEVTDETVTKIYARHGLLQLEEFHCEKCSGLTMTSIALLINECHELAVIGDIQERDLPKVLAHPKSRYTMMRSFEYPI